MPSITMATTMTTMTTKRRTTASLRLSSSDSSLRSLFSGVWDEGDLRKGVWLDIEDAKTQ